MSSKFCRLHQSTYLAFWSPRFQSVASVLLHAINFPLYLNPKTQLARTVQEFHFQFSNLIRIYDHVCALALWCINCFIHKIFSSKRPQIYTETLWLTLCDIANDAAVFMPSQSMLSKTYQIFMDNHQLRLSGKASKFNWVSSPKTFLMWCNTTWV